MTFSRKVVKICEEYVAVCSTCSVGAGVESAGGEWYSVTVWRVGKRKSGRLRDSEKVETVGNIRSREEANRVFESLKWKYRDGVNRGKLGGP